MRIARFPSLSEPQFLGCLSAFVDSLAGELNAAAMYLRKFEGRPKGSAFAYEMQLDHHRYGALMILDRWAKVVEDFGPHLPASEITDGARERVRSAEEILARANQVMDAAENYGPEVVEACVAALQSLNITFSEERERAAREEKLGPMLPEDYREARRIFSQDLAAR